MILICKHKAYIAGRTFKKGDAWDVPADLVDTDVVKSSFIRPETAEAAKQAEQKAQSNEKAKELTATEIKRRLDELGIAYRGNASKEALQQILAAHQEAQSAPVAPA